jgi:hypothetical protein
MRFQWGWAVKYLPSAMFTGPIATTGDSIGIGPDSGQTPHVDPLRRATRGSLYLYQHDVNALITDLAREGTELVVFIDDVDRCSPSTTAEVIEAINLFLSGVGAQALRARFLVGMDPTVIVAHLDHVYSALGREQAGTSNDDPTPGWAFLRKLVQLPITVPRIQDTAVDEFIRTSLATPPASPPTVQAKTAATRRETSSKAPAQTATKPAPPPRETAVNPAVIDVIPWQSIEQHPSIRDFLAERIKSQPDRSVREIKRMINVWQFYHRMLIRVRPTEDADETISQAIALVVLAEIVTRWPALLPHLREHRQGQSGLRNLVANAHDDEEWRSSLTTFQLDAASHAFALRGLRELLVRYDCDLAADLADLFL